MSRPLFFYHPYTQFENLGDQILSELLLRELRARGDLKVLRRDIPADFWSNLRVEAPEVSNDRKSIFFLSMIANRLLFRRNVILVTKPGDVVSLVGHLPPPQRLVKTAAFLALRMVGVRICAIGISTRSDYLENSRFERIAASQIFARVVRDSTSHKVVKPLRGALFLGSDLAFLLEPLSGKRRDDGIIRIAVSFRDPGDGESRDGILRSLRQLQECASVQLVPTYQVDRDATFMSWLASQLELDCPKRVSNGPSDYCSMAGAVSNRLHVLLFAWLGGAAPFALVNEDNRKIVGLFKDLEIEDRMVQIGNPVSAEYILKFEHARGYRVMSRARLTLLQSLDAMIFALEH